MAVRTAYDPVAGEVLTAVNLEKLAGGWIGYNEVTANQASITTEVDLTNLTVAVTVGTGRRIRITSEVSITGTVANDVGTLNIKEGATFIQVRDVIVPIASNAVLVASIVLTPTAGSHTYKLSAQRSAGTGTLTVTAGATRPAFIYVEDVGSTP